MAAAAIVNLISTGSAGLGIAEASSVKGTLLLQLCPSSWIFVVSLEWKLGWANSWLPPAMHWVALAPVGASCATAELNGWCCCAGGLYKLKDPGEHWGSFRSMPSKRGYPSSKESRGEWRHSFNAKLCASVRAEGILLLSERLPVPTQNWWWPPEASFKHVIFLMREEPPCTPYAFWVPATAVLTSNSPFCI